MKSLKLLMYELSGCLLYQGTCRAYTRDITGVNNQALSLLDTTVMVNRSCRGIYIHHQ